MLCDKYSVVLSDEALDNLDKIFEDMRSKLENGYDTIEVFIDAVVHLDKLGIKQLLCIDIEKHTHKHSSNNNINIIS